MDDFYLPRDVLSQKKRQFFIYSFADLTIEVDFCDYELTVGEIG
jgi:hypothetical protein